MSWFMSMDCAPKDGTPIRVQVRDQAPKPARELPWLLRWHDGCWRYTTTDAPVWAWHEPVAWCAEPRLAKEEAFFDAELTRCFGSQYLPSQNPRTFSHGSKLVLVKLA